MFGKLLMILAGILTLVGVGAFSYLSFEQIMGPRELVSRELAVGAKNETGVPAKSTSTQPAKEKSPTEMSVVPVKTNGTLVPANVLVEKTIVAPGPLRAVAGTLTAVPPVPSSTLTVRGIVEYTNGARSQNGGLPALIENELLDRDAQLKLADMFAKQYFEHESPDGTGPADLAKAVGYAYVIVGENLALGDFGSDQGVVNAWMDSPGHRANILNAHYQEIGVAVGKGMYEGRETWLAVQSFGMPISACPAISTSLKSEIDVNNIEITHLRAVLDAKKAQLDAIPSSDLNYNVYVGEFNAVIPEYNTLVENNRISVAIYNASVKAFNECINAVGISSMH